MSSITTTTNPPLSSPPSSSSSKPTLNKHHLSPSSPPSICFSSLKSFEGPKSISISCQALHPKSPLSTDPTMPDHPSSVSPSSSSIDFLTLCHRLKTTKRKGWINHGMKGPESIADHMYRMALMSLIAGDIPGVNRERCIKIAIVHDIAEAIVGDITPSDGIPKEEKSRREQAALNEMCEVLGGGMRADEIKELWTEYETNSSLEANLVKDFDKAEMIL